MNLEKFPVISERGNEYLVELEEYENLNIIRSSIYTKTNNEFKNVCISSWDLDYWGNKYVDLVKKSVKDYENGLYGNTKAIKEFNDWDGKCDEGSSIQK